MKLHAPTKNWVLGKVSASAKPGSQSIVLEWIAHFRNSLHIQRICCTITVLGGISVPHFVWFGILGLLLLYTSGIFMFLAKQRDLVHLRRYHPWLGMGGSISLAIHAVWANVLHLGQPHPLLGLVGLLAVSGVYFGYYAISRARKTKDNKWRKIHWQVELGAVLIATFHALWFLSRILGS